MTEPGIYLDYWLLQIPQGEFLQDAGDLAIMVFSCLLVFLLSKHGRPFRRIAVYSICMQALAGIMLIGAMLAISPDARQMRTEIIDQKLLDVQNGDDDTERQAAIDTRPRFAELRIDRFENKVPVDTYDALCRSLYDKLADNKLSRTEAEMWNRDFVIARTKDDLQAIAPKWETVKPTISGIDDKIQLLKQTIEQQMLVLMYEPDPANSAVMVQEIAANRDNENNLRNVAGHLHEIAFTHNYIPQDKMVPLSQALLDILDGGLHFADMNRWSLLTMQAGLENSLVNFPPQMAQQRATITDEENSIIQLSKTTDDKDAQANLYSLMSYLVDIDRHMELGVPTVEESTPLLASLRNVLASPTQQVSNEWRVNVHSVLYVSQGSKLKANMDDVTEDGARVSGEMLAMYNALSDQSERQALFDTDRELADLRGAYAYNHLPVDIFKNLLAELRSQMKTGHFPQQFARIWAGESKKAIRDNELFLRTGRKPSDETGGDPMGLINAGAEAVRLNNMLRQLENSGDDQYKLAIVKAEAGTYPALNAIKNKHMPADKILDALGNLQTIITRPHQPAELADWLKKTDALYAAFAPPAAKLLLASLDASESNLLNPALYLPLEKKKRLASYLAQLRFKVAFDDGQQEVSNLVYELEAVLEDRQVDDADYEYLQSAFGSVV